MKIFRGNGLLIGKIQTQYGRLISENTSENDSELSKTLLRHDFSLEVELPVEQLCPTVMIENFCNSQHKKIPSRLNYIHWVHDILLTFDTQPTVFGVDV